MFLGIKLHNFGTYLNVKDQFTNCYSSTLPASKLTMRKTQNSTGDLEIVNTYVTPS